MNSATNLTEFSDPLRLKFKQQAFSMLTLLILPKGSKYNVTFQTAGQDPLQRVKKSVAICIFYWN